jgi:restriction system protein
MALKMHQNSLFAILLRSQWWISVLVGAGMVALIRLFLPLMFAIFAGLPFFVIGAYAGWKQLRAPSAAKVAALVDNLRGQSWEEFSALLEAAWARGGYVVRRVEGGNADFAISKDGRRSLVACKRWKAKNTGIEPLSGLYDAFRDSDAHECVYAFAGELSETARRFAAEHHIRLLDGPALAILVLPVMAASPERTG